MERGDIYELIRYGRKIGLRMVMATCGYLIDEKTIVRLKKAGIMALSFSIDGAGAETHDKFRDTKGAFDSTINAAKIAHKAHVRFQINTTISRINVDEVIGIARLAKELGAYCFNPFILVPTGRGREIADEILDPIEYEVLLNELLLIKLKSEIKVRVTCGPQFARVCKQAEAKGLTEEVAGCMGGRGFGFISYRGDVQTCGFLDVPAGNLIENNFDFGKIWEESEFLEEIRNISNYKGNCRICEYVGICGGCRARAYATSGDYLGEDPVCNYWAAGHRRKRVSMRLTKLQKQLCNVLQEGLPICRKPYADLAEFLNNNEETVLQEIRELKRAGVIRRICALINSRALGMTGTLVAAHIPEENLQEVTEAVNSLENVSHNYLREHYYNLWFTLQVESPEQIEVTLSHLSGRFGVDFHSLPVKRVFKLDVRFDAEGEGQLLGDIERIPKSETVKLNEAEKQILWKLEDELEVISEPFDFLLQ